MGISALKALAAAAVLLPLALPDAAAWSNGGFSADPSHPDYGTHDWLAEHAMRYLPDNESGYLRDNIAAYLYGTELPDRSNGTGAIGDTTKHHVYYRSNGTLQDNASAKRAQVELDNARACLETGNLSGAAERAGVMSHYIVDVGVFGHVMGAYTDWGAEVHHSDYETKVDSATDTNISGIFGAYLGFDGSLEALDAYNATLRIAFNTTFGDGAAERNCTWMDSHYNWTDPDFVNSTGDSLDRCVNLLADVLHELAVVSGYSPPDTMPPSVSIRSPADGASLDSNLVNVSGTASDNVALAQVDISLDGAGWSRCDGNESWNGTLELAEGPNTIFARALDTSGNVNITNVSVNVSLPDGTPPSVGIDFPGNGSLLGSAEVAVRGTASDDHVVRSVELSADGATWNLADRVANDSANNTSNGTGNGSAGSSVNWSGSLVLVPGLNTIRARASDGAGNINSTSVDVFLDDVEPPAIIITSPPEGAILAAGNVTVAGTALDDGGIGSVEIGADNASWTPCDVDFHADASMQNASWTGNLSLGAGPGTIYARATDRAGNTGLSSVNVTTGIPDITAPTVTIGSPEEGAVLSSTRVTVTGTASDDRWLLKVEAHAGNAAWVPCNGTADWTVDITLSEGTNTIGARAADLSGNIGLASVNVTLVLPDGSPPSIAITTPADGQTLLSGNVTVSGTARDDRGLARVEASTDNATWRPCAGTENWTCRLVLAEGPVTIHARALDNSGNTGWTSVGVVVGAPDATPPSITITSPANGSVVRSARLMLKGQAQDAGGVQSVEVSTDGTSWAAASGNGTWSARFTLKEGKNVLRVRAVDQEGNIGNATVVVTYERKSAPSFIPGMASGEMLTVVLLLMLLARARGAGRPRTGTGRPPV